MSYWKKIKQKNPKAVNRVEGLVSEYVCKNLQEYNEFIDKLKALDTSIFSELFLLYLNNLPQNAKELLSILLSMLTKRKPIKKSKKFIKLFFNNQGALFEKIDNGEIIYWDVKSGKVSSSYTKEEENSDIVVSVSKNSLIAKYKKLSPEARVYLEDVFIKQALNFSSNNPSEDAKKMMLYLAEAIIVSLIYYAPQTFKKLQYIIVNEQPAIIMFTYRFIMHDHGLKEMSEALTSLYNERAGWGGLLLIKMFIKEFCQYEIDNDLSTTIEWKEMIKKSSTDNQDDLRLMLLGFISLLKNKSGNKRTQYKSFEELLSPTYNHIKIKNLIVEFVHQYDFNQSDIAILFVMLCENKFFKVPNFSPKVFYNALQYETNLEKDYSGIQKAYQKLMNSANDRNQLKGKLKSEYYTITEEWLPRFTDPNNIEKS